MPIRPLLVLALVPWLIACEDRAAEKPSAAPAGAAGAAPLADDEAVEPSDAAFTPGQVWTYDSDQRHAGSRIHIGKIEHVEPYGTVVHVKITGLRIPRPSVPNPGPEPLHHLPLTEAGLRASVVGLSERTLDLGGFVEGYRSWRERMDAGEAGVFDMTLSDALALVERSMNP